MKKIYLILLFCTTSFFGQYTLITDPVFEQNLVNQQIDSDGIINGQVLSSDIAPITQLILSPTNGGNDSIISLQGIEGFIALEELSVFNNESLQLVNVSNSNLKKLYFDGNLLTNVYVNAPLLERLTIYNFSPVLQTLDVTNCPMLNYLWCPNNALNTLDVSNNTALEKLIVFNNSLTQLIIGNNPNLILIYCWNNLLTSLDLINCQQLTTLIVRNNYLTSLNVSQSQLLNILICTNNYLSSIDVSQNTALQTLLCDSNNLTFIDVSQNTNLQSLSCALNNLAFIDVSQNTAIQKLACSGNEISSLNLQNNPQLQLLKCDTNNLTELNIQNGNNTLLNGTYTSGQTTYPRFNASNNPNLHCVFVDDVANCQTNWTTIDSTSHFVSTQTACDAFLNNQSFSATELEVYPKPVSDILNINNHNFEILNVSIYNILGEKIVAQETNKNQIDLSELPCGVYMVLIVTNNKTISTKITKN